jgi:hypothetical protein
MTTKQDNQWQIVEGLLERQQELFSRLDDMSARQSQLIESDQTDQLLELLAGRQGVVDQIAQTSSMLEPYRASWESVMSGADDQSRIRIRRRLDALAGLAERVATRDETDRRTLEQRRESIASELVQVNRGRGAMAAYRSGGEAGPMLHDREA